jgi:hypothetical protein
MKSNQENDQKDTQRNTTLQSSKRLNVDRWEWKQPELKSEAQEKQQSSTHTLSQEGDAACAQ